MKPVRCFGSILAAMLVTCFISAPAAAQEDQAAALDKRYMELYRTGKFSEAVPLAQQALAIREKALGPDHPDVAASLNNLADLYLQQGRYADAVPLAQRSLAVRVKALGPERREVAASLGTLALLYKLQGRYVDAGPLYKRSLAIYEKALGPDHPDVARTLTNLAFLYQAQGYYTDAEPLARRALAINEKALGPDHPDVAAALNELASLYLAEGRYAAAEPLDKRALAIREKTLGPDHRDVAQSFLNLAALYENLGRYTEAEPLLKRSLAISEKALGLDHPDVAAALNLLAMLYYKQGHSADAESLYKRALAICEKAFGSDHLAVANSLNNLALLYQNQGRYADAEPLYERALAIRKKALGPDRPDVAQSFNNLAVLYRAQGRYADAEPLQRRALEIMEKTLGPEHPRFANQVHNLAELYAKQGRYADAEPLYRRALAVREKAFGPDHPAVAALLNHLAELYYVQGRHADALSLVQITIARGGATPSVTLPVLFAAQSNGLIVAGEARDDALNVVQRASQSAAAAAVNNLATRLAAGSDRLAGLVRNDQDLAAEGEALDKAILAAVANEPGKRDPAAEQRMRDRLAEIVKQRRVMQGVFAAEFPDYAGLSNPQPLTVKNIQALLSDGEALLVYETGDKESYVFAVTRTETAWKPIALGTAALSEKVVAFRRGLDVEAPRQSAEGGKPLLFDLGLANDLYAALIGPVEAVTKDARHVLVVPSGPLTALPFHLLVTEKPSTAIPQLKDIGAYRDAAWLIKRQAVSVLPALASLKALRGVARRGPGTKPLVGFGDPVFDPAERAKALAQRRAARTRVALTRGYGDFWQGAGIDRAALARSLPSLLDTADELEAVAAKLGAAASDIHLGSDASEATVKRTTLADYRVVYFATHGLVAGDVVGLGEPSLALTLPRQPTELDDGLLTASEVAQLKLNADWVVLSACNTAAGDKPGAEALSGLARAFFYAGARALLVSHWSVASDAATRLTTSTFAILAADPKLGRADALRSAMLTYMNDGMSPLNAYPAFWGPFSIVGEGAMR